MSEEFPNQRNYSTPTSPQRCSCERGASYGTLTNIKILSLQNGGHSSLLSLFQVTMACSKFRMSRKALSDLTWLVVSYQRNQLWQIPQVVVICAIFSTFKLNRSGPIEHYKAIFSSAGLLSDSANKTHLFHDGMNLTHLLTSPGFLQIHFILYSVYSPETFHILPY